VKDLPFVEKRGGRFVVGTDLRQRQVQFYAGGRYVRTIVQGYEPAVLAGAYWDAVHRDFLATNDTAYLTPFVGAQITDVHGKSYTLETSPNVVYRLAHAEHETFEQIYQIIAD
jgi:hypothetical protein